MKSLRITGLLFSVVLFWLYDAFYGPGYRPYDVDVPLALRILFPVFAIGWGFLVTMEIVWAASDEEEDSNE